MPGSDKSLNPNESICVSQDVRNSPSFQCSIDHGHHVVELHASRSGDSGTFVTFIYEKDSERLLRHVTGTDEDEVILQSLAWSEKNS
ncbi:MAG TPA: hypothetical protein VN957_21540 [Chthoniobacterales bacterium]|jgi:hypothetical protein|nr:hypothetical protein [Chthoniobacterales bacterium]